MKVGYARVSTHEQNHHLQIDALQAAECERIYTDTCFGSVACAERPELQRLCKQLRPDNIVVVWQLDRLGRDLLTFVDQLKKQGVQFASVTERMDPSNSMGWLVFQIFEAMAEFKRDRIRDRTLAGLAAARARRRKGGRPATLIGTALERASQLMCEGRLPIDEISRIVGVSRTTFYRHLKPDGSPRNSMSSNTHRTQDIPPTIEERGT